MEAAALPPPYSADAPPPPADAAAAVRGEPPGSGERKVCSREPLRSQLTVRPLGRSKGVTKHQHTAAAPHSNRVRQGGPKPEVAVRLWPS